MLLVLQSIIVYGLIICVMTYFGGIAYRKQYPQGIGGVDKFKNQKMPFVSLLTRNYYVIPIFVFCFFSAIRYKVGVDCDAYRRFFYEILNHGRVLDEGAVEPAFTYIGRFTTALTDSHYLMFFILAFLQMSFIYYALRKQTYALVYLGFTIMLSMMYFSFMNGVRQNIAACAFVALIPLTINKKRWPLYVLCVIVATLMHKSALLLLPIGLLVYLVFQHGTLSTPIQIFILLACLIFMDKIDSSYLENIFALGEQVGYSSKKIDEYTIKELSSKNFGLWGISTFFTQMSAVVYNKKILSITNNKVITCMYNLFFVGACLNTLFYNNFGISRLNMYLIIFQPIIFSILLFYTSTSQKRIDVFLFRTLISIMILRHFYLLISVMSEANETILFKFDIFRDYPI